MKPTELLSHVHGRLVAHDRAKELYAERLAPDFSPFDFIDTGETSLSRVIAWLLDPRGSHAQGERFLKAFISWLGLDEAVWMEAPETVGVTLEVATSFAESLGYIDILIRLGSRAIAVENKPRAGDQELQVARYLDDLEIRCPGGQCLLYLSGGGQDPSEWSLSEERAARELSSGRVKVHGYAALAEWLEQCRSLSQAPSVAFMIEGFIRHIQREYMGMADIEQSIDLAASISASPEMLKAALALFEAEVPLRRMLLEQLVEDVREEAARRVGWQVTRSDINGSRHSGILIGFGKKPKVSFGIQFDKGGYQFLFYGMESDGEKRVRKDLCDAVRAVIGRAGATEWWPVWKRVGPNDRFFPLAPDSDRNFWLMARDGRLAVMVIGFVEAIEAELSRRGLMG